MKRTEYIFNCDLCGVEGKSDTDSRPHLWVTLELEYPDTGRVKTEKYICDECCLAIKSKHEAN